ncbi:MAG: hypothetical protein JSW71_12600 [Gemmatimonadota bacterium]|nr:MAG: hypothetical protein JSW71_12600 [Gemmatimonadota bacterium]
MISIPVKLHTPDAMFTETHGAIRVEEGRLVLEFESKDAFFGVYRSGVQELEILPDDVASVHYVQNLFKAELILRATSLKKVGLVPGSKGGEIRLRFKRRHRAEAQQLATFLQRRLRELEFAQEADSAAEY